MGLRFFPMNFHACISFILSQNAYLAVILDHLETDTLRRINKYIKKKDIWSKVVSPPQFYVHDKSLDRHSINHRKTTE